MLSELPQWTEEADAVFTYSVGFAKLLNTSDASLLKDVQAPAATSAFVLLYFLL